MRPTALALLALPLLAACATTPLQQCTAPWRAELRTVEADLRDTTETLARGYRLVPARLDIGVHYCLSESGTAYLCTGDEGEPMYDRRSINRAAETAKLAALRQEQQRLEAAIAACRSRFPE